MLRGRGEVAECVTVVSQKQLVLGGEHSYTFDRVLLPESTQEETYHKCASSLVHSTLEGFNATLLAYGQTVSVLVVCVHGGEGILSWQSVKSWDVLLVVF